MELWTVHPSEFYLTVGGGGGGRIQHREWGFQMGLHILLSAHYSALPVEIHTPPMEHITLRGHTTLSRFLTLLEFLQENDKSFCDKLGINVFVWRLSIIICNNWVIFYYRSGFLANVKKSFDNLLRALSYPQNCCDF